jgi:hypothetical protein
MPVARAGGEPSGGTNPSRGFADMAPRADDAAGIDVDLALVIEHELVFLQRFRNCVSASCSMTRSVIGCARK